MKDIYIKEKINKNVNIKMSWMMFYMKILKNYMV